MCVRRKERLEIARMANGSQVTQLKCASVEIAVRVTTLEFPFSASPQLTLLNIT